ncbi:GGDEF domain-containing protein [Pulveribacter suum]|uniref:diguanylate cyclase n=1 Tax=Pulveribacter suum TaxID=2116657 RepID=A0A2P1NL35_9BURK|nr:GGDEF domain-containing protein [Pulveribacter suum]AVP57762.1 GGDEF domain-containing protein [Pulveribacter suum]
MKPLLRNLAEMTAHRDHLRLEVSVVSTLLLQGRETRVRALEMVTRDAETWLRPRSWSDGERIVTSELEALDDPAAIALRCLPELARCIAAGGKSAERIDEHGHTLWMPVWLGERAHACLEITQPKAFTRHQRDVVSGVHLVYQNYQSLLDYSERDALTGLLNRKTFDEQFTRQSGADSWDARHGPDAPSQWLAVVDIDHFKRVNDQFGHLYGDEVLILVANQLRSLFRAQDRIFRFGGEEFVVLLRSATLAQARQALERLRVAIESHAFPQIGHISVSIGFAGAYGGAPVEIIGRADQALYFAKEHGRNQVRYYEDLVASASLKQKVAHDEVELF